MSKQTRKTSHPNIFEMEPWGDFDLSLFSFDLLRDLRRPDVERSRDLLLERERDLELDLDRLRLVNLLSRRLGLLEIDRLCLFERLRESLLGRWRSLRVFSRDRERERKPRRLVCRSCDLDLSLDRFFSVDLERLRDLWWLRDLGDDFERWLLDFTLCL